MMMHVFPTAAAPFPEDIEGGTTRDPPQFLRPLLRRHGALLVTLAITLLSILLSVLCGVFLTPLMLGPITPTTILITVIIPAVVAPPIVYLAMRMAYELDVARERLQRISLTDELTRMFNRRYLFYSLALAIERSRRYRMELSVLMMDIDHFKSINDAYGHLAGDQVLKETARRILSEMRGIDFVARYGGEEFVAVLSNTGTEGAYILAERMRRFVAGTPVSTTTENIGLTISIGVAVLRNEDRDFRDLLERADGALYLAKTKGRNRVVVA